MDKHFLHHLTNNWQHKSLFTLSILGICLISSAFTSGGEKDKPTGKTNTPSSKEVLRYKPFKPITTYTPNPFYQVTATPTVSTVSPTRNKVNAARNSAVALTFSEAMGAATASSAATKVRGSMQGNLSGTFSGAGTPTATFTPAKSFKPGETVSVSITAAAQNSGGTAIQPHVYSFTAASAAAPATFPDAPKTVSALSFPHGVFVADINGDGTLDIATVNQGSNQVTIRKNDGAGNFTAGTNVSVGLLPESIFMADFDGDGDMDLATANVQGHSVSIRKNDGMGLFTGSTNVDTKIDGEISQSTFVYGADFDGDGDIDLATADAASNAASILMNDGAGNFTISDQVYVAFVPLAVTSADFDNDGDMDLALTSSYLNSVSILDNNGTGSFTFSKEISVGTYPSSIYAADFDGDGLVDIATANRSSNTVSILTNNGGLVFSAGQTFAVGTKPQTVYGGDIDGDGDIDLTTTNSSDNTVSIRLNNGNGGFSGTTEITTTKTGPYALQLADMDGDNTLDIVAATSTQSSVTIIQNKLPVSTNTAPTITTIANQSTCKGTALAALALTVGDTETAVGSLTVTGTSTNTTLLPNASITFGGTGANRTVTLTPASGQTGTATITLTVTDGGALTATSNFTFTVNNVPSITVTAPTAVCAPATVDLTQLTVTDANTVAGTLTYWKDAAATTAFTTPTAAPAGTYYIKKTATTGGCSDIKSVVVTVNAAPTVVAGTAQSICTNAAATQLTGFSPAGGTWSGNGVNASGLFTPTASLVGAQTLTYSVTQNGCTASATKTVTVTAAPTVTAGTDETVCVDANTLTLAGFSPAGGTWSGTGVTAPGVFSTSAGTQILTYTVTQNGCTSSATKKVTVAPTVAFTLTTTDNTNCLLPNGSIEVVVTSGGTVQYSKDNVTFQTNPVFSGLATGDYTIYVKNQSCSAQKTITLAGPDAPIAFAVTGGGMGCTGDPGFKVGLATSQMGITYQLLQGTTPVGNTVTGTGSALDFGLQAAAGTYTISATNSGNCKNTMTGGATIAYTAIPSITITAPTAVCAPAAVDLTQLTITDANNADGTFSYWTDATATTAFTNSTAAPAGTYYIKKTTAGGCFDIKSVVVTEKAALVVVAGTAQSVCVDAAAVQLADFSPTGGVWSGNGVSASGVFTPTTSLVGAQTLTYTVTQNGCSASATKTVTVTDRPVAPVASANTPTLGGSLNLKASTLANATYQWTGPDNFTSTEQNPVITNVTNAKAGKYSVVATVGGCSSVAGEVTVTVQTIPTVTFSMPTLSAQPATQVVVPVRVKDFTKIASLQGSIRWDKAVATFTNVEAFGLAGLTKDNFGGNAQTDAGILTFSWFESTNLSSTLADSTVIFAIRFTIAGNEGTATALTFSDDPTLIEVSNEAAQVIKTLTQPGSIKVVSIVKVAGTVKSANGKAIKDIGLTINDGTTTQKVTADATGAYQFMVDSGTSFTVSPFKNNSVSATNGISTLDLILIQRHILGKTLLDSPYKLIAADVNNDKAITTRDILQIRSLILTSATSLPGNRQWAFVRSDFQFNSAAPFQYDSTRVYTQASQVSAQDFIGIRLGDVNDSWDASVARIATAGEVQFTLENHQALPASEITIPVKVADFNALKGYQFTLNWNPAVLEFKEIQAGGVTANYGVNQAVQGKITTSWQDAQGNSLSLPDDSTAFSIRFKVVGQVGSATNLAINSSLTASEAYNYDLESLRIVAKNSRVEVVTALEEKVYGYVLEQNQPNPFASTTMIGFSLPKEENVNVSIYNSVGQLVSTTAGHYQKGKHQIEWNGIHPNGQKLAPGTYFYRLQAGQFVEVKKAIILE